LGGKVAEANKYITTPVDQALNTYCMPQLRDKTEIVISTLGENAGLMGSVAMVMEHLFEDYLD